MKMGNLDANSGLSMLIGGVIGLLILGMLLGLGFVFLGSMNSSIGDMSTDTNTVSNEIFTGVNGTPHALAKAPLDSITVFGKSTSTNIYNNTNMSGNNTTNTNIWLPLAPLSTYDATTAWTLHVAADVNGTEGNANVSVGGTLLGALNKGTNTTDFTIPLANRITPLNISYVFGGRNISTITNTSLIYYNFTSSVAYAITDADSATITPTENGTFRTTYKYLTFDYNPAQDALDSTQGAMEDVPGWMPLIILTIVLVVILTLVGLVAFYAYKMGGVQ